MRRLLLTPLLAVAVVLAPQAGAAEPAPAPTVQTSVITAGQAGPKVLLAAHWEDTFRGTRAQLQVTSTNPPATTSTVEALWTSAVLRVYPGQASWTYKIVSDAGVDSQWGTRYRLKGGAWSRWTERFSSAPGGTYRLTLPSTRQTTAQVQLRIKTVFATPGRYGQSWSVTAFA